MAIAAQRVFAIPELLEGILVNLTFEYLYTIQRTSKTFKTVMADSKKLRQSMHLEVMDGADINAYAKYIYRIQQELWPWRLLFDPGTAYYSGGLEIEVHLGRHEMGVSLRNHVRRIEEASNKAEVIPSWRKLKIGCKECATMSVAITDGPLWTINKMAAEDTFDDVISTFSQVDAQDNLEWNSKNAGEWSLDGIYDI